LKVARSGSHLKHGLAPAAIAGNQQPSTLASKQTPTATAAFDLRMTTGSGLAGAHSPLTASADLSCSPALA
jgi:hypothetical protein